MKVIDLLNKIAKGKEVPEYIKYIKRKDSSEEIMYVCKENIIYRLDQLDIDLNDEIEIIEEEKEIEEIELTSDGGIILENDVKVLASEKDLLFANKINELVRELNKIKKEGK